MDVLIPLQLQRKELYMAAEEKNNDIQAIPEKRTYSVQEIADILQISRSMASIIKRDRSYAVVYYEGVGKKRQQVWESGLSYTTAKSRKAKIELEQAISEQSPPTMFWKRYLS